MELTAQNSYEIIELCWNQVISRIDGGHPLSSEKTLVFLFAVELYNHINNQNLVVDFEPMSFKGIDKTAFLDLIAYTDEDYKVAFEFKLPKSSKKGSSDQTQNRINIYRDLFRLQYLVNNDFCSRGFFLMATTERAYTRNGRFLVYKDYKTHHDHSINGMILDFYDKTEKVSCRFEWRVKPSDSAWYWLSPIDIA